MPKHVFEEDTTRECIGYVAGDGLWKEDFLSTMDDWTLFAKDFKYTWKPIDCSLKAPFLCQYNPGKTHNK